MIDLSPLHKDHPMSLQQQRVSPAPIKSSDPKATDSPCVDHMASGIKDSAQRVGGPTHTKVYLQYLRS